MTQLDLLPPLFTLTGESGLEMEMEPSKRGLLL